MSANSIFSCSFRLLTARIPHSLHERNPLCKTTIFFQTPTRNLFSFKSISFERVPMKPSATPSSSPSTASNPTSLQPIEELPPKLQEIVKLFQSVQEPKAKYEQLLFYGKNLKPLDDKFKTRDNKVEGCVSQVWVRTYLDQDKNLVYEADSDSVLTKGLAALLVQGFSGSPVEEVVRVSPDFVLLLGLQQSLTPSRNNGFLNMLKLMQKKALMLYMEAEKGRQLGADTSSELKGESFVENSNTGQSSDTDVSPRVEHPVSAVSSNDRLDSEGDGKHSELGSTLGSRGKRIKEKLEKELHPVELRVEDVSYKHTRHAGARGSDGETHFNLIVLSEEFEGKSLVKRHRLIYNLLQEEMQSGLHALSIVAKTPSEVSEG